MILIFVIIVAAIVVFVIIGIGSKVAEESSKKVDSARLEYEDEQKQRRLRDRNDDRL